MGARRGALLDSTSDYDFARLLNDRSGRHRGGCWTQRSVPASRDVGCAHFPRLYCEYAAICERHGVVLRQSSNMATAVGEMLDYIFKNNAPRDFQHHVDCTRTK